MERYRDGFYRNYLIYTGLETDLLFFVVCDAMFLTKVKHLTLVQYSRVTFLSLLFSLLYRRIPEMHRSYIQFDRDSRSEKQAGDRS